MSHDSDIAIIGRSMREDRKRRHLEMKARNTEILAASGIEFRSTNNGETLLFRNSHDLGVDFFPSTGRWCIVGDNKTYKGGAEKFLKWYKHTMDICK
jgi:hypothetical protein